MIKNLFQIQRRYQILMHNVCTTLKQFVHIYENHIFVKDKDCMYSTLCNLKVTIDIHLNKICVT